MLEQTQKRDLVDIVATEKEEVKRKNKIVRTLIRDSKNYRDCLQTSREPSNLNVCRIIAQGRQRQGVELAISDNLLKVYPSLKDREPSGKCGITLIDAPQNK